MEKLSNITDENKEQLIEEPIETNNNEEKTTLKKYAIIHGYNGHKYSGNQK